MKEYSPIVDVYSREGYEMYSSIIPATQWGNRQVAENYLDRYWLSFAEYERSWKPLQDRIFSNQERGLPEMIFRLCARIRKSGQLAETSAFSLPGISAASLTRRDVAVGL
jgi:hypothetical protein